MKAIDARKKIQELLLVSSDGVFGPRTMEALNALKEFPAQLEWQRKQVEPAKIAGIPADTEEAIRAVYGPPGDDRLTTFEIPYPMRIAWDTDQIVKRVTAHELCKDDLLSIFKAVLNYYGSLDRVQKAGMDLYGGIYNYRKMRGGTSWSRHAWGIAIDLDPDHNGLNTAWPKVATMPEAVINIFEAHGWKSYARSMGRDAMHFQRTR